MPGKTRDGGFLDRWAGHMPGVTAAVPPLTAPPTGSIRSLLHRRDFRAFLLARMAPALAGGALSVVLGFHLYALTRNPLDLGWLGLAEAVPAVGLVLYGGHAADRHSRRWITLVTLAAQAALALGLALGTAGGLGAALILVVAVLRGTVRALGEPAIVGLQAQVIPAEHALRAVSVLGSAGRAAFLLGPALGGLLYAAAGPAVAYAVIAAFYVAGAVLLRSGVPDRGPVAPARAGGAAVAIVEGIRYVFSDQVMVGSMMLDLFAVFFGGATALLPVYAADILHVGPAGLGLLRAASSFGGLAAMLLATRHPPRARAGLVLHLVVAGFGVSIIVFGLSTSFALSLAALACAGAFDGVSMVIRQAIMQLIAPDGMRGRIAAVRSVFITSSNELGDFESGIAASLIGAVPAVWLGGVITLAVVAVTAWRAPVLRRLDLGHAERQSAAAGR
jgi:MFS family permease